MLCTLLSRARALVDLFRCLAGSFVALNVQSSEAGQNPPKENESANVFEAVVRYQIASWELGQIAKCQRTRPAG
jgi:hypothetical protein